MCNASLDPATGKLNDIHFSLVVTKPPPKKKGLIRVNLHDLDRAKEIVAGLKLALKDVDLIMVEMPVGSQSASGMKAYGICVGILSVVSIPMVHVTASEVKLAGAGNKNATKKAMIDWGVLTYPELNWLQYQGRFTNANEHLADALAAIYAGIETDAYKQMKVFFK